MTSVLLDSIRLTYCFYHISFKIFSKKWRCPYIVSIIYSELYWCLLRTHDYRISSLTKCCHLNGYDFIKHCLLISFDMFVNINKYLYILYIFACYLFYCLCIYSRTLAHVATVTCWLYPTLNKFYLILSYLITGHFWGESEPEQAPGLLQFQQVTGYNKLFSIWVSLLPLGIAATGPE